MTTTPPVQTVPKPRQSSVPDQGVWGPPVVARMPRTVSVSVSVKVILGVILVILSAVFLLVLGVKAGENSQTAHRPDAGTLAVLQYAQSHSDAPCYAVWGPRDSSWSVKCGDLR